MLNLNTKIMLKEWCKNENTLEMWEAVKGQSVPPSHLGQNKPVLPGNKAGVRATGEV